MANQTFIFGGKRDLLEIKHHCLITVEYKAQNFSTRGALLFTKECVCTIMNVVVLVINYLAQQQTGFSHSCAFS